MNNSNPSIISFLHELGHYLFGPSELKTCRFSVGMFKTYFKDEMKNLKWEGHMLTTKSKPSKKNTGDKNKRSKK